MTNVKVTIALPTYNRAFLLKKCIMGILGQSFQDYELIIIDDGSEDQTMNIATSLCNLDSRIRYYKNDTNIGLPATRNIAVALSQGEFIFFVEDDLLLNYNCLENLMRTYDELTSSGINVGAIGPRLVDQRFKRNIKDQHMVFKISKFTGLIHTNYDISGRLLEVPTLHACSLINKVVFKEIGGYDSHLYKGTSLREETDLYYRAIRKDYRLFYQPSAIAVHKYISSGGCRLSRLRTGYYNVRNHIFFLIKFYRIRSILMCICYLTYIAYNFNKIIPLKTTKSVRINERTF